MEHTEEIVVDLILVNDHLHVSLMLWLIGEFGLDITHRPGRVPEVSTLELSHVIDYDMIILQFHLFAKT